MKLLLVLAFVVSCWAALTLEARVEKCAEAVVAGNQQVAGKLAVECLKIVRKERKGLRKARADCRTLGEQSRPCRQNVKKSNRRLKKIRKQIRKLERCLSRNRKKAEKRRKCASMAVFGVDSKFQLKPVILGPLVKTKKGAEVKVMKKAIKAAESGTGNAAG
jgi:hypothetical protein